HVAIIAAATAATVHGTPAPKDRPKFTPVRFISVKPQPRRMQSAAAGSTPHSASAIQLVVSNVPAINVPYAVPNQIPAIDLAMTPRVDFALDRSGAGHASGNSHFGVDLTRDDDGGAHDWSGTALLMRIVASAKPRYPESLRQAAIDGAVLVQFTVDTL